MSELTDVVHVMLSGGGSLTPPHLYGRWNLEEGTLRYYGEPVCRRQKSGIYAFEVLNDSTSYISVQIQRMLRNRKIGYLTLPFMVATGPGSRINLRPLEIIDQGLSGQGATPNTLFLGQREGTTGRLVGKPAYYLSGFDPQERTQARRSWFGCRLPEGIPPETYSQGLEMLKPEAVKLAESMGTVVKRQGDIFAIPIPSIYRQQVYNPTPVLDTNHKADYSFIEDGLTYARGGMHHDPAGRAPDHKSLDLGGTFHLLVKNTVPVYRRGNKKKEEAQ